MEPVVYKMNKKEQAGQSATRCLKKIPAHAGSQP